MSFKPLLWKNYEKSERDDFWPKKLMGSAIIYHELNKYYVIGGQFNSYENLIKNYDLNTNIIKGIDKKVEDFGKLSNDKVNFISESVNNNLNKNIEVYLLNLNQDKKWNKINTTGRIPPNLSGHRCIYIKPYIFLYGGVTLGSKGENYSLKDLYVLNTINNEWKYIINFNTPENRAEFSWVKLDKTAILYGGASLPSEILYNDMWLFRYDNYDFNQFNMKEIKKEYWSKLEQFGEKPDKLRGYSMEYYDGYLYLFGGIDSMKINRSNLYRYNISKFTWELIETKGKKPPERCYHEMCLINKNNFVLFGGIKGYLPNIEIFYNDIYLFNVIESVWVEPIIGGVQPSPRIFYSLCCNYNYEKMEVIILGGHIKENDNNKYVKIFLLNQNEFDTKNYWTIRDYNFKEEQNDENYLLQSELQIREYRDKIDNLEIQLKNKEIATLELKQQIDEHKKNFFKEHGFIDDQTQSLEDIVYDLETRNSKVKQSNEYDSKIIENKIKLRYIMERKNQSSMDFFCSNQNLFIKYYDALMKMIKSYPNDILNFYSMDNLNVFKDKYHNKLTLLKIKLEKLNKLEEKVESEMFKFKKNESKIDDLFKNEIDYYKANEDSFN